MTNVIGMDFALLASKNNFFNQGDICSSKR